MEASSSLSMASDPQPGGSRRDLWLMIGLIALVLFGLAGLALATGWQETWDSLTSLTFLQFLLLLALSLVNYFGRAVRWHVFARTLGLNTKFWQDARHFMGGFAMSVTPGRVGELVRMRWIRRETGWSFERTAPLVLMDRAADLAAMALLLALALAASGGGVYGGAPVAALALLGAFVVTRPGMMRLAADLGYRLSGRRAPRLFARVRRAAASLQTFLKPGVLTLAMVLGLAGWLAEGYAFYLLLGWMGADTSLWMALAIFIFSTLAGGLTGAPGGVGGAEAAMLGLLVLDGVPLEIALPATLIIRVTTLWFAILIGLGVFPFAEKQSLKAKHALEIN